MKNICLISFSFISFLPYLLKSQNTTEPSRLEILQHWAPKIYQDVRKDEVEFLDIGIHQYFEAQDFIVKLDFDGDWYSGNSKDNSSISNGGDYSKMTAHAYTSFVETDSHYFLQYGFFHANDDAVLPVDQHNNDYEQVYISIKKNNSKFGEFVTMFVNSHGSFFEYEKNDLLFENSHLKLYITSNGDAVFNNAVFYNLLTLNWADIDFYLKGHSITSYKEKYNNELYLGEDAIIYNVGDIGEVPKNTNGRFKKSYNYSLVDFNELWNRRFKTDQFPFTQYGYFHGDKAHLQFENDLLRDPAKAFSELSKNKHDISRNYTYNPFLNNSAQNPVGNPILSLSDGWIANFVNKNGIRNASLEEVHLHRNAFVINAKSNSDPQSNQYFDDFLFTYKPMKGNSEISGRVYSIQNHIDPSSSAGIMIRNSLDASSKFISIKTDEKNNIIIEYREADGSALKKIIGPKIVNELIAFKITRNKDVFDVYYSISKNDFSLLASIDIDMESSVFAGVLSYTENKERFCSIIVDNIKINQFETPLEEVFVADLIENPSPEAPNFYVDVVSDVDKKLLHIITKKTGELKDAIIYIYDMQGRLVLKNKLADGHNRTIDTGSLKDGAWPYMIRIINYDGKEISQKVYL